ncbi:amidohydrolase [Microbacterium sp. Clip185]|uniref:amidohydrolase n=1 Tax=Microbacterium sp. Clip185 TaxID=3025663 RepID=UPI002364FE8C|nr:amidohydrolase family protein [Microbacterium sp. Clip185]WDG16670.1 amidohydrolase family protein [Microbacterium sp. Clip185]
MSRPRIDALADVRIAGPGAELLPGVEVYDIVLQNGRIADIAPAGSLRLAGAVHRGEGAYVIPGLWDHHVHVTQWALAALREPLGECVSAADAAARMGRVAPGVDGRRVGTGFRDALWPDAPSLEVLDAATGDTPTYLINADVHSVWLNSAALAREGLSADDGVLREGPAFDVSRRLNELPDQVADAAVTAMAAAASARGVVGVVDLDMVWNESSWQRRRAGGFDLLRVEFGIYPDLLDRAIAEGLRSGDPLRGDDGELVTVGPLKAITDGSLGTRTAACSVAYAEAPHPHGLLTIAPDDLRDVMTRATAAGLDCAIHAIGDDAMRHALDAYAAADAHGTIEHAQLVAAADIPRMARLGVTASVQPEHALDDRDLTDSIWVTQTARPYPLRSLWAAGVDLRFGSDAPVSALDPWAAIATAAFRTRDGREPWQPGETVPVGVALAASTHRGSADPDTIAVGQRADLALLAADPRTAEPAALRSMQVVGTVLDGRVTHRV